MFVLPTISGPFWPVLGVRLFGCRRCNVRKKLPQCAEMKFFLTAPAPLVGVGVVYVYVTLRLSFCEEVLSRHREIGA